MPNQDVQNDLLHQYRSNLYYLRLQAAQYSESALPLNLHNDIQATEAKIAVLEQQVRQANSDI